MLLGASTGVLIGGALGALGISVSQLGGSGNGGQPSAAVSAATSSLSRLLASDAVVDAACGGAAYGCTDAAYALDTLKVRIQSGAKLVDGGGLVASLRGLYEGVGASAAFRVVHGAVYMPVYSEVKHRLLAAQAPLAAAVVASATAATVLISLVEVPVEALLLRVKSGRAASGFLSAARAAAASPGGVAALYAGAGPFIARHVLYESTEFLCYEMLRARATRGGEAGRGGGHGEGLAPGQAAVMAFAAATVATVASQPLDCIRVACSLSAHGAHGAAAAAAATGGGLSTLGTVRAILQAKGPAGFFTGLLPRLATLAPGAVIFFSAYEASRSALLQLRARLLAASQHGNATPAAEEGEHPVAPADVGEVAAATHAAGVH